jgi:hypothetical protein
MKEIPEASIKLLISEVDIPRPFRLAVSLQTFIDQNSEEMLPKIIEFIRKQIPEDLQDVILALSDFHNRRPLKQDLIAKVIAEISHFSSKPLSPSEMIISHPFLAFKLVRLGIFKRDDVSRYFDRKKFFAFLICPSKLNENEVHVAFRSDFKTMGKSFPIEEIGCHGYAKNSVQFLLKYDLFEDFGFLAIDLNFNIFRDRYISPFDLPTKSEVEKESLLTIAAFYGSIRCFKFLVLNEMRMDQRTCKWSIKGGNCEIISICENEHGDFQQCLPIAVSYLRNTIADWLLQTVDHPGFSFKECIESFNVPAFFFLFANRNDFPILINNDLSFLD